MKTLILISWDGKSKPHELVDFDAAPAFDLLTFDYSGKGDIAATNFNFLGSHLFLSHATECKGQIIEALYEYIKSHQLIYDYIGIIDDDILVRVSGLNYLLHIAEIFKLDAFAPALSLDSISSVPHTAVQPGNLMHYVPWVEIMMPFYRLSLLEAVAPFYPYSISSYGIDRHAMPLMQAVLKMTKTAVIDAVIASHIRPITSQHKIYSNGMTAEQEAAKINQLCDEYRARHALPLSFGRTRKEALRRAIRLRYNRLISTKKSM